MTRKHRGIIQEGDNKGKLRKGFFYSGERTKNGLPVIKEKKHIQNGGTRNSMLRLLKQASALGSATAGLGLGEARSEGAKKAASKFSTKIMSQLQPLPPRGFINDKSVMPKIIKQRNDRVSFVPIHPRISNLFTSIAKTSSDKSEAIMNEFITGTIDSFLNPMEEGDLFRQSGTLEPIVILRIIIKATRNLIENLAQTNTENEIKNTFSNNYTLMLNNALLLNKERTRQKMPNENPKNTLPILGNLFHNNPLNTNLLLPSYKVESIKLIFKNQKKLYDNKKNILKLLDNYYQKLLSKITS